MQTRNMRDQIVLAARVYSTLTRDRILSLAEAGLSRLRTNRIALLQTQV